VAQAEFENNSFLVSLSAFLTFAGLLRDKKVCSRRQCDQIGRILLLWQLSEVFDVLVFG